MRHAELVLLLGALACADGDAKAAVDAATQTAAAAAVPQDSAAAPASRPLHLARVEERAPTTFPHDPHLRFDCTRCHAQVTGHERHANVACRKCHEAPAPTSAGASPGECGSCHHARTQPFGCLHCHDRERASPRSPAISLTMRLAGTSVVRTVAVPHARHSTLPCTACHAVDRQAKAGASCNSCHERHHLADADCAACHSPPREGVHQAAVHRGCGGEACHQDAAVRALPLAPAVCLSCHPSQARHEPGGDCAGCHNLQLSAAVAGTPGRP